MTKGQLKFLLLTTASSLAGCIPLADLVMNKKLSSIDVAASWISGAAMVAGWMTPQRDVHRGPRSRENTPAP